MKIKILTTLILIILLSACGDRGKDRENHVKILGFKGKVKLVKYSNYDAESKFGEINKGIRSSFGEDNRYYYFNEKGVKIEEGEYDFHGQIQRKKLYKYNENGNLIETKDFNLKDEYIGKTIYKTDDNKNLIETNDFNSKDEFIGKTLYIRDDKENAIETNSYDSKGNLYSKLKSEYDTKGRVLEVISYGLENKLKEKTYIKYDGKGRIIEIKVITDGSVIIKNFNYENKEKDDLTLMVKYEDYLTMSKTIYRYKYDENGNWIQKISIEDGKPKIIEEREIEYYM